MRIREHKTKITGAILVALGAIQANATLIQPILTPQQYALLMIGAGVVVAVLGFLNSHAPNPESGRDHEGLE